MQSWSQGQNGGDDNSSWQQDFNFAPQNDQFDQNQGWSHPVPGQHAYGRQLSTTDPSANFLQDPNAMLSGYQDGHGSFDLNSQFPGQNVMDPSFSNMHPDMYAQQNKMDLSGGNMQHMNAVQGQTQPQHQGFPPQNYNSFEHQGQNDQHFRSNTPQYSQAQLLPQATRQQSHTPVQQFSNVQPNYSPTQAQVRPTQASPVQQQQQSYSQNAAFSQSQLNGQSPAQYQSPSNAHLGYQQSHAQPYNAEKTFHYQQNPQSGSSAPFHAAGQQQQLDPLLGQPPVPQQSGTPQPQTIAFEQSSQAPFSDGPAKKRQRVTSSATDSPGSDAISMVNNTIDSSSKKIEELDNLVAPTPTPEDVQALQQFQKRTKAVQAKFPPIKGMPHLAHESTVKLPAPKSYDKLVPLVATPSRSKKPMAPEAGYALPCEIQGRFTSQYRPAFDRVGLDERRMEAKPLLDDFDASMKSLGKKRPKYTEYPHAFKEQLKADEASKNKAAKKTKKEMDEERNKPIRPPTRPADPVQAAAWDAIGIVHIESNTPKTSSLIAGRVQQAGDFFIKLRAEMNQAKQDQDQAIKENKPEAEVAQLKKNFEIKKDALHRAFDATVEHADDAVMDNLGGHQKLVLSLVNVLIASIKASDFNGKLPKVVLELFSHLSMTKKIAETQSFDTVRKRFLDKGDDEVKGFVRDISAKVKKALKPADSETSTGYTGTSAASRAKAAASQTAASTKRGRDDDSADGRTVKKVAVEGSGSLSKKLAQPKLQLQSASKTTAAKAASSSILGDKMRPKPAVKSESASGGDSSVPMADDKSKADAKKVPAKADAAKVTSTKSDPKPPAPKMGAAPTSGALSGIASLLDSINSKRPETPPTASKDTKESDAPETEEQKAKRLRKEARRKLRVSWKPDKELVQVKIFEKEVSEDEGRDMNMIRDAGDDKSEGMVLKQRADVEDDDEEDDIPYQPWMAPNGVDFSALAEDVRNKNFTTRGGNVTFTTEEQERIAQREQRELMAIYADPDDIPPTPKSPPPESVTTNAEPRVGQFPQEGARYEEILTRWRDEQQMGVDGALYSATQRLNAKSNPSNVLDNIFGRLQGGSAQAQGSSSAAQPSLANLGGTDTNVPLVMGAALAEQVLAWLRSDQAKRWQDPNPSHSDPSRVYNYRDPGIQAIGTVIEALAKNYADKPYPATAPPDWLLHDEERVREWRIGYNKEAAVRQKRAEEERARIDSQAQQMAAAAGQGQGNAQDWAAYFAQQQQQDPQAYAPYMAILQQMNGGQNQQQQQQPPIVDSQVQSFLASMGQPPQGAQPPAPPAGGFNPHDPAYQQLMMMMGGQQGAPPPPPPAGGDQGYDRGRDRGHDDWDRHDRDRRYDHEDDYGRGDHYGRGGHKNKEKKKPGPSTIHKPPNAALIGTKPCTFWQQGKCARGDKCTFRHD